MKRSEKEARLRRIQKRAGRFTGLWENPDFQDWRNVVVRDRLKSINKAIVSQNVLTKEGQEIAIKNIMRYQALKSETGDIFKIQRFMGEQAIKKLKKLKK